MCACDPAYAFPCKHGWLRPVRTRGRGTPGKALVLRWGARGVKGLAKEGVGDNQDDIDGDGHESNEDGNYQSNRFIDMVMVTIMSMRF